MTNQLEKEASGVCPETDKKFIECVETCSCFLTATTIAGYVSGCRAELFRQRREPPPEKPSLTRRNNDRLITLEES